LQNPFGNYDTAISFGASQSSIYGDVSYSANAMFYSNLNQASLSLGRTKMYLNDKYKVSWIESIGIGYSNNYGAQSVSVSFMRLKPMGNKGTIGMGLNYSTNFGKLIENTLISFGYNFLYANSIKVTDRLIYSPAFILAHTPITYATKVDSSLATNDVMFILSNSFTYRITKTFTINFGYTAIKSTNTDIPLINSFMIGSKLPF
jgi:long-subunit fatty acid transport protein